jgi:hypothetical protein
MGGGCESTVAVGVQDQPDPMVVAQPVGVGAQGHPAAPVRLQSAQRGGDVDLVRVHKYLTQKHGYLEAHTQGLE